MRYNKLVWPLTLFMLAAVTLASIGLAAMPKSTLASSDRITPKKGVEGDIFRIQGSGLDVPAESLTINFGVSKVVYTAQTKDGKVNGKVPPKWPTDPNKVTVSVKVDGIETDYPNGPLTYEYRQPK